MEHHDLDIHPIPREKAPMYINEPWLIDGSLLESGKKREVLREPETQEDNIRVYIPLDLNRKAILRRLDDVIQRYGIATELNESGFRGNVGQVISQLEIYDQIWHIRRMAEGKHSCNAVRLVQDIIQRLEAIPDGCAECFPFELIDRLKAEYLEESSEA